ncbi:DUF3850 domain-containing protein [Sulfurimonas crateris]|uniref:DUF3850 domain-containing protein n=1 Tax=Sulfurimonas crateris TaxID=2574727 RepID=A0A4U2Z476_9BACT|nr:DUF3850 domain-containing protein [Sulfurimonas crateris]TKI68889.1 DUF3850 domain-containing protein [Sulfurimonas crateris]
MRHNLKIMECRYRDIIDCLKTFEIRYNDRNYSIGDTLILHPISKDGKYLHGLGYLPIEVEVVYIDTFQQKENYLVLGICY